MFYGFYGISKLVLILLQSKKESVVEIVSKCDKELPQSQHANQESKGAKIRNRYNQVPYHTQDTNGNVTNSQLCTTN